MSQRTHVGRAVTVALTPATEAEAVMTDQPEDRCSHVGKLTSSRLGAGLNVSCTVGQAALLSAVRATTDATGAGPPGVVGTHVIEPGAIACNWQVSITQ